MINNKNKIVPLLDFTDNSMFYFVQILQRKKDNPEHPSRKVLKQFMVKNDDELTRIMPLVKTICEGNDARAYISLNRRNYERVAKRVNLKLAEYLLYNQYEAVRKIYFKCVGASHDENKASRRILVDLDTDFQKNHFEEIVDLIRECDHLGGRMHLIPSKNGFSVVTHTFNTKLFETKYRELGLKYHKTFSEKSPDIHRKCEVNLYIP